MKNSKIVYVADIAGDIDDMAAIVYLHSIDRLECVVPDGKFSDIDRIKYLENQKIKVSEAIPDNTDVIFCGGSFTKIADYCKTHDLRTLVVNGFFAGENIVPEKHVLPKFKGKVRCPSYNPNLDTSAALEVLRTNIDDILVVSKNVCHHPDNVYRKWHTDTILETLNMPETKKLHDVLMVKEGLNLVDHNETLCQYAFVDIWHHVNANGRYEWSATPNRTSHISISLFKK